MNGLLRIAVEERIGGNAVDRLDDGLDAAPRAGWRGLADTAATPDDGCRRGGGTRLMVCELRSGGVPGSAGAPA